MRFIFLILILVSCSLLKPAVHNKMIFEMEHFTYDLSLVQLRDKVLGTIARDFDLRDSAVISFNIGTDAHKVFTEDQRVCTNWYDEFSYNKKKFYAQSSMIDPAKLLSADYRSSLVKRKGREDVILLKNHPNEFIFVQNHLLFRGVRISATKSQLFVEGIRKMIHSDFIPGRKCEPCNTNELKEIKNKTRNITEADICNIDLEKSLKFKRRLLSEELKFLYYIAPKVAKSLEQKYSEL